MRKLVIILFFALPTFLSAQLELGIRAGMNMTDADLRDTNGDLLEAARINGVNVGGFANIQIGNIFAIQPEVTFSQKGFKVDNGLDTGVDTASTVNMDYLDFPLMLEMGFALGSRFRIYGNAGPNISYLLNAEEEMYDAANGETTTVPFDFSNESLDRWDTGVNFGGGFSFRMNRWKYSLDARYNMGLKEIMASGDAMDFVNNAKHRMTNISVTVSYFVFGGKKKMMESQAPAQRKLY